MTAPEDFASTLAFFGIGRSDAVRTPRLARAIRRYAPQALARFYDRIAATPQVARFFTSRSAMDHARTKQIEHWAQLFSEETNAAYRAKAEHIGIVHARIGLEPAWYIGGYAMVLEEVITRTLGESLAGRLDGGRDARAIALLVKLALLDMSIALSAYFKAEEERRNAVVSTLGTALAALSRGDFTVPLTAMPAAYAQIERDFETMRQHISTALRAVADGAMGINAGASEIRAASNDLARRTESQAANLEETAAALDGVSAGVRQTAEGAEQAHGAVSQTRQQASEGRNVVGEAVQAMADIQKSSQEISQIINVIDGIAFQTNLLALNAGVEAARAGDAGRGFAVVASEVRALAQRSADAAADIKKLIQASGQQVDRGVTLVGRSGEAFEGIAGKVAEVSDLVQRIAMLSNQQAQNLGQVNAAVREMDRGTQQNAAMVEQSNAAASSLAGEAERLNALVSGLRLDADSRRASASPQRAAA